MPRVRQIHECEKCGFQTHLSYAFKRHQNRRTPCDGITPQNQGASEVSDDGTFVANDGTFVANGGTFVANGGTFVANDGTFVANDGTFVANDGTFVANESREIRCTKCSKTFKTSDSLRKHISLNRCKGVDSLTCEICGKCFDTRYKKAYHKRTGKCVPAQTIINNITNDHSITNNDNSINTTNNIDNRTINNYISLSLGREDTRMLDECKLQNYLAQFEGLDKIIPAAKALYFHPEYPQNHGILKTQSTKQKTLAARKKDGSYYTSSGKAAFHKMSKQVIPKILPDPTERMQAEFKLLSDQNQKHILVNDLINLINENPHIEMEELERDYHTVDFPPSDVVFEWPSKKLDRLIRTGQMDPKRHVMYINETPEKEDMFGIAPLYKELVGDNGIPPGAKMAVLDNGLDDRWTVVRVWNGREWTRTDSPEATEVDFLNEIMFFFACMAVDLCDALMRYAEGNELLKRNFSKKIEYLDTLRDDLIAGEHHDVFVRNMYA